MLTNLNYQNTEQRQVYPEYILEYKIQILSHAQVSQGQDTYGYSCVKIVKATG